MRTVPSTILVALCLLLAGGLAALWISEEREWNLPAPQALSETLFLTLTPRATTPSADIMPNTHSEIATRPLFNPGRRPAADASGPALDSEVGNIALIGVFSAESTGGAILMIDGEARRMRTGERVGGLTLLAVDDTRARLIAADGNGFELTLQRRLLPQAADQSAGGDPQLPDTTDAHDDEDD